MKRIGEAERLRLLRAGWQPLSDGWLLPAHRFGTTESCPPLHVEDALWVQEQVEADPEMRAEYCPFLSPLPTPPPTKEKPKPKAAKVPTVREDEAEIARWRRDRPEKEDDPAATSYYPSRPMPLYARSDARRVSHKAILDDESPWQQIALRDWEDNEMGEVA